MNQLAHDCLMAYEVVIVPLIPEVVAFLDQKRHKILQRMSEILGMDTLSGSHKYGYLTAMDILEFLGSDEEDPFKRIIFDRELQKRVKEKVIEDSDNVFPTREVSVTKRPKIEDCIVSMFTD